jgi:hypothetical protein
MTVTLTAFVTTSDNPIGADAGISVFRQVTEDGVLTATDEVAAETVTDGSLDAGEDDFDGDAAASLLAGMGYAITGTWGRADGQWAVSVEPAFS